MEGEEIRALKEQILELEKRIRKLEVKAQGQRIATKGGKKDKKSITDHLLELKSEGYFDEPRLLKEIVAILASRKYHYKPQSLTATLQRATNNGMLGKVEKEGKLAYCKR